MYSLELMNTAKEFWYIFDNRYLSMNPTVNQLYLDCNLYRKNPTTNTISFNLDWMFFSLKDKMRIDPINYEQLFVLDLSGYEKGIRALANDQIEIINQYLSNIDERQQALELFGQGVLYDKRRGVVHKMQGVFPQALVGYRRWHGFARASVLVGEDYNFWLHLDRCILLAYLIQAELRPLDTKVDNPFMDQERLNEYRLQCMGLDFKALDEAFNFYFP